MVMAQKDLGCAEEHVVLAVLHMGLTVTSVYPTLQFPVFTPSSSSVGEKLALSRTCMILGRY